MAQAESKTLAPAYKDRLALYITNTGEKPVWLAFGETAKAKEGPLLVAKTGTITIQEYGGPVAVITEEGESLVTFAEV